MCSRYSFFCGPSLPLPLVSYLAWPPDARVLGTPFFAVPLCCFHWSLIWLGPLMHVFSVLLFLRPLFCRFHWSLIWLGPLMHVLSVLLFCGPSLPLPLVSYLAWPPPISKLGLEENADFFPGLPFCHIRCMDSTLCCGSRPITDQIE